MCRIPAKKAPVAMPYADANVYYVLCYLREDVP